MKIKPKKIYENIWDAMESCMQRLKDTDIIKDGDIIEIDSDDAVVFEVEVKDEATT